ncbi:hypothetical protein D3C85_1613520 [compost metagenome]
MALSSVPLWSIWTVMLQLTVKIYGFAVKGLLIVITCPVLKVWVFAAGAGLRLMSKILSTAAPRLFT